MDSDFFRGCHYAFSGIKTFWTHPKQLWIYALCPFVMVKIVLFMVACWLLKDYVEPCAAWLRRLLEGWGMEETSALCAKGVTIFLGIVIFMVLAAMTSTLFELFGSVFFSYMVRKYEKMAYGFTKGEELTFKQDCINSVFCVIYSIGTLVLYVPLMVIGFILPVLGQLLTVVFIGFRYGISYCSEAGFNRGWSLTALQQHYSEHRMVLYGFGICVFVLLMIPVVSLLFIPGFVIGGTQLVHEEKW